ncbi:Na(+)/H(+) antiporter subunit C [Sediminivirga luteola]|uniref:Na(+)/H(+) antiporter subunit C n=1 Tax=Sediminivirga luteola TaxID=1774748 RepID=UPI0030D6E733
MTPSLTMLLLVGVLVGTGVYLMLERSLTRVVLGFILFGNGANLLILLAAGEPGRPPLTDGVNLSAEGMTDPLPQALVLTAIVITFGLTAFLLAMIYRSWRLARQDVVQDDEEDIRIASDKDRDATAREAGTSSGDYDDTEFGDEAERPVDDAPDLDEDGTPAERAAVLAQEAEAAEARVEIGEEPEPGVPESQPDLGGADEGELADAAEAANDPEDADAPGDSRAAPGASRDGEEIPAEPADTEAARQGEPEAGAGQAADADDTAAGPAHDSPGDDPEREGRGG